VTLSESTIYDVTHLLNGTVLLLSFALLYQRRLFGVLSAFAMQSLALALAAAWQAFANDAPHLYITASIALFFKTIIIPVSLHRIVINLGIHREVETALGIGATLIVGASLAALTRENLALSLSVVLLGLLMMITRRNAVTQVVGFMSLENGLLLAAVGVRGMPFVVEISAAFAVMVAFIIFIIFGVFFFQIRERFDTLDVSYVERFRGERH